MSAGQLCKLINVIDVQIVPIPKDCTDGFGGAFWARPERYLESGVQEGMSTLALLDHRPRSPPNQPRLIVRRPEQRRTVAGFPDRPCSQFD
jgi:hypothetical protein